VLAGTSSLFIGNAFQAQMPEFAHDFGRHSVDFSYSMLLAADAIGALLGGLILESRGLLPARPKSALILAMLWCLSMIGFAAAHNYTVALIMLFAAGFLQLAFNAMAQTIVQLHAPAGIRGRVIGLYSMSALGLRAFSSVSIGLLGSMIGIHWSLIASALAVLAIALALLGLGTQPANDAGTKGV
jgi:MFS family permease